jgi:hypothetical protein
MTQMNKHEQSTIDLVSVEVAALDTRLTGVEHSVDTLVADNLQTRQQLGTLISAVSNLADNVKSQGDKLDVARTSRTPPSTLIAGTVLFIAIFGAVLWPANKAIEEQRLYDNYVNEILMTRGALIQAARDTAQHNSEDIDDLSMQLQGIQDDRFRDTDGDILRERINRLEDYILFGDK